jgi:hypothetical protein
MTPTRKREIQAFLTGITPAEFRGKAIEPPDDIEVKNWIISTPSELLHKISRGPGGDAFRIATNAALARIAAEEMKGRPPANGRSGGGSFLEFSAAEVSSGVASVDPERSKR